MSPFVRRATQLLAIAGAASLPIAATAAASSSPAAQVKSVYRTVLTAEYFGPASGVCSHLTASGVHSYIAGGASSCTAAFKASQHVLKHKMKDVDDSGFTPSQWRTEVKQIMATLKVSVHGSHATAIGGDSGIPGQTKLVLVGGKWKFSTYPPSIQS
jgi:hypothetical protein